MKIFKNRIYFETFFRRGIQDLKDDWGVYFITGYQGSGKNYFATFMLSKLPNEMKIKTNVKSLKMPKKNITYFEKISDIVEDTEEKVIYLIDEVSKKYTKTTTTDNSFYGWLQQSRKRKRICILITQEWKEVPMWLRRPARYMFHTNQLLWFPIFVTTKGDAINQTINTDTLEWECPILERYIYKRNKKIANYYDTYEPINQL